MQGTPSTDTIGSLLAYMNHDVEVEIAFGRKATKDSKQSELPINSFGTGEQRAA